MRKKKNRWYTEKGKIVSVCFGDIVYDDLSRRSGRRGLSAGLYLRWLLQSTVDDGIDLKVEVFSGQDVS